jgi:dihydrofolate reductase
MSRLIINTFLTLDGIMQAPGGTEEDTSNDFDLGGWLVPYADEDMGKIITEIFAEADCFLLGRKTYEIFAAYWPLVHDENNPVAAALNSLPKYVVSKTLNTVEWNNSILLKDNIVEEIKKLKSKPGREIQVHGSSNLAQILLKNELIDEFHLWIYPVVLGRGKRLFETGSLPSALRLVDTKTTSTGVLVNTYHSAGKPVYGSFAPEDK